MWGKRCQERNQPTMARTPGCLHPGLSPLPQSRHKTVATAGQASAAFTVSDTAPQEELSIETIFLLLSYQPHLG